MTDMDKLFASRPVNKQAALAVSKGTSWDPAKRMPPLMLGCPPMRPVPWAMMGQGNDLTGQRFGRFTVVGLFDGHVAAGGKGRAQWVARCDCGNYEVKKSPNLKNGSGMCVRCHYLKGLREESAKPVHEQYDR